MRIAPMPGIERRIWRLYASASSCVMPRLISVPMLRTWRETRVKRALACLGANAGVRV